MGMSTKQYLTYQAIGSIVINGAIGFGTTWPRRHQTPLFVWGHPSLASDTLSTAFLLSVLTVLMGSIFVRLDAKLGRVEPLRTARTWAWAPTNVWKRAMLFGPLWACAGTLVAFVILSAHPSPSVSFQEFITFKVAFSVLLGLVVTPINAQAVLVDIGNKQ